MRPSEEEVYMRQAIAQALVVPQRPFGAVLVETASGRIVARGYNRSTENPTWHGEIEAINLCAAAHPGIDWTGLTLYSTAEPCPMCQSAILWAGIARVVYGTSIAHLRERGWRQIDISAGEVIQRTPFRKCLLTGGILESECNTLFDNVRLS